MVLIAMAALCATISVSLVSSYADRIDARVGPLVNVLVAIEDIPEGVTLTYGNARRFIGVRQVAQRYAPDRAFSAPDQVLGYAALIKIPAGTFLSPGELGGGQRVPAPDIRKGERAEDVAVTGASGLGASLGPGSRVDVLVTSESRDGSGGRSFLALEDVEVLAVAAAGDTSGTSTHADVDTVVTLRVNLKQAVFLTAAQNFAKEIRVLARAVGDRRHTGRMGFSAQGLAQ